MKKFAVLVNSGGATFVKDYDYFISQGGDTEIWGKHWKIVEAESYEAARVLAIQLPGAHAGLYCPVCGCEDIDCHCERIIRTMTTTRE